MVKETSREMTPSQKRAINESRTMGVLVRSMSEDGAEIVFRDSTHNETLNLRSAQIRTADMVFDWIVTPRGRIVHEDYSLINPDDAARLDASSRTSGEDVDISL